MNRGIDHHEVRRPTGNTTQTKLNMWREAWNACYQVIQQWDCCDLRRFHIIFEYWVPLLNIILNKPIPNLERYQVYFYYCTEPSGPKEIIHMYVDENPLDERMDVHIVFNVREFNALHSSYCCDLNKSNQLLVNEERGTINMAYSNNYECNPADYFKTMAKWQMLFVHTLHVLAHWDVYDKYDHAHYDTHLHLRDSPFYKVYFYGQVVYRK